MSEKNRKPLGRVLLAQQKLDMAIKYGAELTNEDLKELKFAFDQLMKIRNAMHSATALKIEASEALIEHVDDDDVVRVAGYIKDGQ